MHFRYRQCVMALTLTDVEQLEMLLSNTFTHLCFAWLHLHTHTHSTTYLGYISIHAFPAVQQTHFVIMATYLDRRNIKFSE
jgi:hypothetical protein